MKKPKPAKSAPPAAQADAPKASGAPKTSSQVQSILGMLLAGNASLASWDGCMPASFST